MGLVFSRFLICAPHLFLILQQQQPGPDTGVDTLHKVEGPGPLGGPGGPRSLKGRRRKMKEKEEKTEKNKKKREKEERKKKKRGKKRRKRKKKKRKKNKAPNMNDWASPLLENEPGPLNKHQC